MTTTNRPKISIAIPIIDSPKTAFYLSRLLKSLDKQTFKDYEIVITKEGDFSKNHNAAILKSKGELIKLIQLDDYFSHPNALQDIVDNFEGEWLISACEHNVNGVECNPHYPVWTDDIFTGNNRLGSVSTLTIRNETKMLFEEGLTWVVDCDLYKRYYDKYGPPTILNSINVVIDTRNDRLSSTLSDELKQREVNYLIKKYASKTV